MSDSLVDADRRREVEDNMTTVNTPITDAPASTSRRTITAGRIALGAGAAYVVILLILHAARSDVSVEWQTTSEYARGSGGWVMVLAFMLSALSLSALFVGASALKKTVPSRIGLVALALVAIGTAIGGVFVADPIETPQTELSTSGTFHGLGAGLALMLTPLAAILLNLWLARKVDSQRARVALRVTAFVPLAALIGFMTVQAMILPADGLFGPDVPIGPAERALVAGFAVWQLVTAAVLAKPRVWR